MPKAKTRDWSTLVGKFFHEIGEAGYVERQGAILAEPYPKVFVITYFAWITGNPGWGERLVTLDYILQGKWRFYTTVEELREGYEHGGLARPMVPAELVSPMTPLPKTNLKVLPSPSKKRAANRK